MIDAYIMIKSDFGAEEDILREIGEISGVKEAYQISGVYDIIVRVVTRTSRELKELIEQNIRKVQHVQSTLTMITIDAADSEEKHVR